MTKTKHPMKCDYCGSTENVKEILYGMPSKDFDESKYAIGGCVPSLARWICLACSQIRSEQ